MSQLSTLNQSNTRKLSDKQQSFLDNLVETKGDAKLAAQMAGYKSSHYHLLKSLKQEVLDITQEILAQSAPKAAFKLLEIMEINALADWVTNDPYDEFEALRVMIEDHLNRT
jgi:hypothetical protein